MPDQSPTCLRYFLKPDGSLDAVPSPGRCAQYWQLRDQALFTEHQAGGLEMQIKLRLHEQRCPHCRQYFADCERYSHSQNDCREADQPIQKGADL